MQNNLQSYQTIDTMGKSQLDLILKVYDGALKAFADARAHYEKEEYNPGYEKLERAKRFVTHLYTTLNTEEGGEVAENLGKLYTFVIMQIQIVEATKELKLIDDSVQVLKNLREGWAALKKQGEQSAGKSTAPQAELAVADTINTSG